MEKSKPEVWGYDKDGDFTIDGKTPTEEQHRQIAESLKGNLPEKYLDPSPELKARLKSLVLCRTLAGSWSDSQSIRDIRAVAKSLYPKELLRSAGSLDPPYCKNEPPPSRMDYFLRLIYLQSKMDNYSFREVIDKALGRLPKKVLEGEGSDEIQMSQMLTWLTNGQKDTGEKK